MYNGILLLDKPYKWSSNFTLNKIKNIFNFKNIGYVGTLDPIATGILPILFGNSKKLSKHLSESDKCYDVIAYLGTSTDTYDSEGSVIKTNEFNINEDYILSKLHNFHGNFKQNSPIYSNVKYLGKHSYEYARKGIKILEIPRFVTIYNIKFFYLKNNLLKLRVLCSKGTYIRSLVNYIGDFFGCGAYVYYLRRIKISNFDDKNIISFYDIYKVFNYYNNNKLEIINSLFIKKIF